MSVFLSLWGRCVLLAANAHAGTSCITSFCFLTCLEEEKEGVGGVCSPPRGLYKKHTVSM